MKKELYRIKLINFHNMGLKNVYVFRIKIFRQLEKLISRRYPKRLVLLLNPDDSEGKEGNVGKQYIMVW